MPHSNGYITAPVSISDVRQVLNASSNDLGTLCISPAINKWAKYKPVGKNKISTIDELNSDKTWSSSSTWWKGNSDVVVIPTGTVFHAAQDLTNTAPAAWITICGIKYLGFTAKIDVVRLFNPAANHWAVQMGGLFGSNYSHVKPAGGSAEPFRLTDFNQYWHNAYLGMYPDWRTAEGTANINKNASDPTYACSVTTQDAGTTLGFSDIFAAVGTNAHMEIVLGVMDATGTGMTIDNSVGHSWSKTGSTYYDTLDFASAYPINRTYIGFYCAVVTISGTTYHVPLMQSGGDTPNITFPLAPNTKAMKLFYVSDSVENLITLYTKRLYSASYVLLAKNQTISKAHEYMKLDINNKKSYSSLYLGYNSFKIELTGANGGVQFTDEIYDNHPRLVFKQNDIQAEDWGSNSDADNITIPPGTEMTVYLAMYGILSGRSGVINRIRIFVRDQNNTSEWPADPMAEFGALTGSDMLNIQITS